MQLSHGLLVFQGDRSGSVISLFLVPGAYMVLEDLKRIVSRADPEAEEERAAAPIGAVDEAMAREALDS